MIKSIEIKNLFGRKNRTVLFNKNLTIVVGKNGSGKTTILNILNAVITKNFEKLFNYEFTSVIVNFLDKEIHIEQEESKLHIQFINKNERRELFIKKDQENKYDELDYSFDSLYFPTYRRLETDLVELLTDSMEENTHEIKYMSYRIMNEIPKLLSREKNNTVLGLSNKDINSIIQKKWNEVTDFEKKQLNSLINEFFLSLLQPDKSSTKLLEYDSEKFNSDLVKTDLEQMFQRAGIINSTNRDKLELINKYVEKVQWANNILYLNKTEKKNKDIDELSQAFDITISHTKIDQLLHSYRATYDLIKERKKPFDDLINSLNNFLDIEVEIQDGRMFFVKEGSLLEYSDLSAGEKQLVALFVYSKLQTKEDSIVIIDEPELSLHLNWQRKFIENLTNDGNKIQFIISTHSPFVISNYRDEVHQLSDIGDDF